MIGKSLPLLFVLLASTSAAETRQLDAHEHGVGSLDIAIDGAVVAMAFKAPGADIVGFEYVAETEEKRAKVNAAIATLSRPLDLFQLSGAAECSVASASAELETEASHKEHTEAHDHDHEEHDHADAKGHAGHDHNQDEEQASGGENTGHTEFHAEYSLTCSRTDALTEITFAYFDAFENARELEVQIVGRAGAQSFDVTREAPVLDLRSLF